MIKGSKTILIDEANADLERVSYPTKGVEMFFPQQLQRMTDLVLQPEGGRQPAAAKATVESRNVQNP